MTEAAIDSGLTRDLYVALGEPVDEKTGAWGVRIYVKPFIDWIWFGCIFMAIGGALAMADKRYRIKLKVKQDAPKDKANEPKKAGKGRPSGSLAINKSAAKPQGGD
jgi:cytochrome c-type biogenesis protein CcmF